MENDFMPQITEKWKELRIKNDIPLDTVLPDLTLLVYFTLNISTAILYFLYMLSSLTCYILNHKL